MDYKVTTTPDGTTVAVTAQGRAHPVVGGRVITGSNVGFRGDIDLLTAYAGSNINRWAEVYNNPNLANSKAYVELAKRGVKFGAAVPGAQGARMARYDISGLSREQQRQIAAEVEDKGSISAAVRELARQSALPKEVQRQIAAEVEDKGSISAAVREINRQVVERANKAGSPVQIEPGDDFTQDTRPTEGQIKAMGPAALERYGLTPDAFKQETAPTYAQLQALGAKDYTGATAEQKAIERAVRNAVAKQTAKYKNKLEPVAGTATAVWQGVTPWDESKGEQATKAGVGLMAAELVVPGVYLANRWDELSAGERAAFIGIDVISLIPVAAAATRGARSVATAGRLARVGRAAKAVGGEALLMARAPVDMVINPVGAAKTGARELRSLAENIAHPKRIPEAVITTSEGTIRLKITKETTPEHALAIRDSVMELVAKGERPVIEIGEQTVELTRSPLMREAGGGVAHATPSGGAFEQGVKVATKEGMPLSEQGLFVANEPLPRFAEASAFGKTGDRSVVLIMNGETTSKAVKTGKLYNSPIGRVAEMELKLPVGAKVPPPAQKLFTRIGTSSHKLELWLEKPLTYRQIAKLKAEGILEAVKAPFKPAIKIKGRGMVEPLLENSRETKLLTRVLNQSGNVEQAANLKRAVRAFGAARRAGPTMSRVIGAPVFRRVAMQREALTRSAIEQARITTRTGGRDYRVDGRAARQARSNNELIRQSGEAIRRESAERAKADRSATRREGDQARAARERGETPRREPTRAETPRERAARTEPARETPIRGEPTRGTPERTRITDDSGTTKKVYPRLGSGATDKEKREYIDKVEGLVARRRGEIGDKAVWHVSYYPYRPGDKVILLGEAPAGAVAAEGTGSMAKTLTLIRGVGPGKPIYEDTGAVDDIIYTDNRGKVSVKSVVDKEVFRGKNGTSVTVIAGEKKNKRRANVKAPRPGKAIPLGGGVEQTKRGRHLRL